MNTNTLGATLRRGVRSAALGAGVIALVAAGCRSANKADARSGPSSPRRNRSIAEIHGVRCLYDQRPWINADVAGDPDPEGVRYRVFLDPGDGNCVLRDGSFHVELYRIKRTESGDVERTLESEWDYPTSEFGTIHSNILGKGYHLQLRWAKKDIAGNEIELITQYIGPDGNTARSATKRLRAPKYSS